MLSAGAAALSSAAGPAAAAKSRTAGYPIQKTEEEWAKILSPTQYYILREGGTERPNSSPLYREKRAGMFHCAACDTPLFSSKMKFDSGTGWPSFARPEPGVEVLGGNPVMRSLLGAELRCRDCGGHLGDVFDDGFLFQGTEAAVSGQRYCIDGAALVFRPADGSAPRLGEPEPGAPQELPDWLQPPPVGRPAEL